MNLKDSLLSFSVIFILLGFLLPLVLWGKRKYETEHKANIYMWNIRNYIETFYTISIERESQMTQHPTRIRDAGNIQENLSRKSNGMAVSEEPTIFPLCNFFRRGVCLFDIGEFVNSFLRLRIKWCMEWWSFQVCYCCCCRNKNDPINFYSVISYYLYH